MFLLSAPLFEASPPPKPPPCGGCQCDGGIPPFPGPPSGTSLGTSSPPGESSPPDSICFNNSFFNVYATSSESSSQFMLKNNKLLIYWDSRSLSIPTSCNKRVLLRLYLSESFLHTPTLAITISSIFLSALKFSISKVSLEYVFTFSSISSKIFPIFFFSSKVFSLKESAIEQ